MAQLPPGVDEKTFHPASGGDEVRARLGLTERPVIVCVSRLVPRKGQDTLILAMPRILAKEPEAVLLEGKLIKEFHPRYNVSFRDDKRFLLVKVNLNDPIPRFTLTRLKQEDGARYFGPFASSGALRRTLNLVRHRFNLRGCRPLTPGEPDYKHCLYAHLKVCTAPCIGNVTREQYRMQVLAACDFLDGQSREMKEQLEAEMKKANELFESFEKIDYLKCDIEGYEEVVIPEILPVSLPVLVAFVAFADQLVAFVAFPIIIDVSFSTCA